MREKKKKNEAAAVWPSCKGDVEGKKKSKAELTVLDQYLKTSTVISYMYSLFIGLNSPALIKLGQSVMKQRALLQLVRSMTPELSN